MSKDIVEILKSQAVINTINQIKALAVAYLQPDLHPKALSTIGSSGAGKSTLIYNLFKDHKTIAEVYEFIKQSVKIGSLGSVEVNLLPNYPKDAAYICATTIREDLSEIPEIQKFFELSEEEKQDPLKAIYKNDNIEAVKHFHRLANIIADEILTECIKNKYSFVYDTTFGSVNSKTTGEDEKAQKFLNTLTNLDYDMLGLAMEVNKSISDQRAHDKPYDDKQERDYEIDILDTRIETLHEYCPNCKIAKVNQDYDIKPIFGFEIVFIELGGQTNCKMLID